MSKIKKRLTLFLAMICVLCMGGMTTTLMASAENTNLPENNFSMVEGAGTRLDSEHYGLRYSACVGNEIVPDVQYKMMIIPESYLTKYDSQIKAENNDYYKAISGALKAEQGDNYYLAVMDCTPVNTNGAYYIKASLTNLKYGNLNRNFEAFAFYTDNQGNNVYATKADNSRDIVTVAYKAMLSGEFVDGTTEYDVLNKIITNGINALNKLPVAEKDNPVQIEFNKSTIIFDKVGGVDSLTVVTKLPKVIEVTYRSDNEKVATVVDGQVTAVGVGSCKVYAKVLGKEYPCDVTVTDPIKDYTKAKSVGDLVKTDGIGTDGVVTFANINNVIKEPDLTNEQIKKITLNNTVITPTVDAEKITIAKTSVPKNLNGSVVLELHTDTEVYKMNVTVVYANIANVNDFTQFFSNVPNEYCKGEIAILSADIDCTTYKAQNNQPGGSKSSFSGTFDGRGHAIKNISVGLSNNRRALFRIVNTGATIKNIAFIDSKVGFSTAYYPALVASELYGTVENCFVSGTNNTENNGVNVNVAGGIVNQINNKSVVKNCISHVEFSGTAENNALIVADNRTERTGKEFSNCYGISSTATKMVGNEKDFNTKNLQAFANVNDFGVKVTSGLEGEGWSEYWQIKGTKLYFGNNIVLDWTK